jgi:mannose-6-phosphate isomerase-like protein (cupin superfamily)
MEPRNYGRYMNSLFRIVIGLLICCLPNLAGAHEALRIRPLAEKMVAELPAGPLIWTIETFDTVASAKAAEGPWSLVVESEGKVWLFSLGKPSSPTSSGTKVAEVGPIPRIDAKRYLLRINDASGPPGSVTPIHTHPGSEAFFVLSGEQSIRGASKTMKVSAGHSEPGQGAGNAMEVSSSGTVDLHALVMFVLDGDKPFSSPATLP